MATLPDGTTVTLQKDEGWNINPPASLTQQFTEGWNDSPPPETGLTITANPTEILAFTGTTEITGTVSDKDGNAVGNEQITARVTHPDNTTDETTETADGNGDYTVTYGPYDTEGKRTVRIFAENGFTKNHIEGWNT